MITEKRLLQAAVAAAATLPVWAGSMGVLEGRAFVSEAAVPTGLDSHFRYLCGLLLAIGLTFWACVPHIERRTATIRTLTLIVAIGGLARAYGAVRDGWPGDGMAAALVMELVVTPLLCLWQARVARQARAQA